LKSTGGSVNGSATGQFQLQARLTISSPSDGIMRIGNWADSSFTRLNFGLNTNSAPALANGTINGFAIQSAAGTDVMNDNVTAASGTVAVRSPFQILSKTLTATNASTVNTDAALMYVGIPIASTNVSFTNSAKVSSLWSYAGPIRTLSLLLDSDTEPTCDVTTRGRIVYKAGGAGVADTVRVCAKATADTYAWTAMATIL
jgi:hypothetical protein